MKESDMDDNRYSSRTVCKRNVTFHVGEETYTGAIENMSNYGASILAKTSGCLKKGTAIRIALSCDDQVNTREASVVWSEEGAFGAKFI